MNKSKSNLAEHLDAQQRNTIRRAEGTDAALARKYGVTAKTIREVREPVAKAKPKAKRAARKKDAPAREPWLNVLGGPELPRPIA